jgi:hypothetical protein
MLPGSNRLVARPNQADRLNRTTPVIAASWSLVDVGGAVAAIAAAAAGGPRSAAARAEDLALG